VLARCFGAKSALGLGLNDTDELVPSRALIYLSGLLGFARWALAVFSASRDTGPLINSPHASADRSRFMRRGPYQVRLPTSRERSISLSGADRSAGPQGSGISPRLRVGIHVGRGAPNARAVSQRARAVRSRARRASWPAGSRAVSARRPGPSAIAGSRHTYPASTRRISLVRGSSLETGLGAAA
jgi:hypothetical protein